MLVFQMFYLLSRLLYLSAIYVAVVGEYTLSTSVIRHHSLGDLQSTRRLESVSSPENAYRTDPTNNGYTAVRPSPPPLKPTAIAYVCAQVTRRKKKHPFPPVGFLG